MSLIKDASLCRNCGQGLSLKHGVYCDDLRKEAYQVFCLNCEYEYRPHPCAIVALQNARDDKMSAKVADWYKQQEPTHES